MSNRDARKKQSEFKCKNVGYILHFLSKKKGMMFTEQ